MDPVEGHDGTQLRLADDCSLPHPGLRWPYPRPHAGAVAGRGLAVAAAQTVAVLVPPAHLPRSEEHTSELQSLMRISSAVFCLKKKPTTIHSSSSKKHNTKY